MKFLSLLAGGIIVVTHFTLPVAAETEFQKTMDRFCDVMKKCTLQQMEETEMPPAMKDMLMGTIDASCKAMYNIPEAAMDTYPDIVESARACIDSLADDDCGILEGEMNTPQCQEYEKKLNEIEVN